MRYMIPATKQKQWLRDNWRLANLSHKWSCRGYGNSRILDASGCQIAKASGCGYDRYGAALGEAITSIFPNEVHAMAVRYCKGRDRTYKQAPEFYGLFYNAERDKAWLDGACGSTCMQRILEKIGFQLVFRGETNNQAQTGEAFYTLEPMTKG